MNFTTLALNVIDIERKVRLNMTTEQAQDPQRKRLYWHSRRGMWELDLLLVPFLRDRYDDLSEEDQALYRALLEEEDQDLFSWLMRRNLPDEADRRRILLMIIDHAESGSLDQYKGL